MIKRSVRKISPLALGIALCVQQAAWLPVAQAASLGLGDSSDQTSDLLAPALPEDVTADASLEALNCALNPGETLSPDAGAVPSDLSSQPRSYRSDVVASADLGAVPQGAAPDLVAQAVPFDDCCEIGGNALCEIGGIPPQGGGALLASPLLALAGLPLAAIPFIGGGGGNPNPVPEPGTTAALVAGFGLAGLTLKRRMDQKRR